MRYYDITFELILRAIYKQWKTIVIFVLIFSILGVGFGAVLYSKGDKYYDSRADSILKIEDSATTTAEGISDIYVLTKKYLNTLLEEESLTSDQIDQINVLKKKIIDIEKPVDHLCIAKKVASALPYGSMPLADVDDTFSGLVSIYEKFFLQEEAQTFIQEYAVELERQERIVVTQVNALIEETNNLGKSIANDNRLTISVNIQESSEEDGPIYDVVVTHGHVVNSAKESFRVTILFCVLAGLCVGAVCAIVKEAALEKNESIF